MKIFILIAVTVLFGQVAQAFPEMIRHGYVNCTACHVSPSGGGVLTTYGRELSRELMSTWGGEKESRPLHGIWDATEQETLRLGGDVRAVQVLRENERMRRADFIPMQADLEFGVDDKKFASVIALGLKGTPATRDLNQFVSRRHYLLVRVNDEVSLRAGKFMKSFGLNSADHTSSVRRGLGWDQGQESYNLEASYLGEKHSFMVTAISDDPEEFGSTRENGLATTWNYALRDSSRIGLSHFYGRASAGSRDVFGVHWIFSFTPHLFWSQELDWQWKTPAGAERSRGYAMLAKLGFEVFKGFIPTIQIDRSQLDLDNAQALRELYGVGLQWFPRPHWEISVFYNKEASAGQRPMADFHWLMLHYYL